MNLRKRLSTSIGSIQAFLGIIFVITAFLIYHDLYNIGEKLGQYKTIGLVTFLLLGVFSLISGLTLSSE